MKDVFFFRTNHMLVMSKRKLSIAISMTFSWRNLPRMMLTLPQWPPIWIGGFCKTCKSLQFPALSDMMMGMSSAMGIMQYYVRLGIFREWVRILVHNSDREKRGTRKSDSFRCFLPLVKLIEHRRRAPPPDVRIWRAKWWRKHPSRKRSIFFQKIRYFGVCTLLNRRHVSAQDLGREQSSQI